jgi:hypothetical protein
MKLIASHIHCLLKQTPLTSEPQSDPNMAQMMKSMQDPSYKEKVRMMGKTGLLRSQGVV